MNGLLRRFSGLLKNGRFENSRAGLTPGAGMLSQRENIRGERMNKIGLFHEAVISDYEILLPEKRDLNL